MRSITGRDDQDAPMLKLGLGVALASALLDQATKYYFHDLLVVQGKRVIEILPFFNLVTVWNYGVSFGMFNNGSSAQALIFVALSLSIVAALVVWLRRVDQTWVAASLGLVIGGAVGNVIDRLVYGAVFDFLDVHAFGWHWPAFNVADSAITVGVALLVIDSLFARKPASG
jgi:signal peptidase II